MTGSWSHEVQEILALLHLFVTKKKFTTSSKNDQFPWQHRSKDNGMTEIPNTPKSSYDHCIKSFPLTTSPREWVWPKQDQIYEKMMRKLNTPSNGNPSPKINQFTTSKKQMIDGFNWSGTKWTQYRIQHKKDLLE